MQTALRTVDRLVEAVGPLFFAVEASRPAFMGGGGHTAHGSDGHPLAAQGVGILPGMGGGPPGNMGLGRRRPGAGLSRTVAATSPAALCSQCVQYISPLVQALQELVERVNKRLDTGSEPAGAERLPRQGRRAVNLNHAAKAAKAASVRLLTIQELIQSVEHVLADMP